MSQTVNSLHDLKRAKGISIVSLNIRSLFKHLDEVQVILEEGTIDIITAGNISQPMGNGPDDSELQLVQV